VKCPCKTGGKCVACGYDYEAVVTNRYEFAIPVGIPSQTKLGANTPGRGGGIYRGYRRRFARAIAKADLDIPAAKGFRRVFITRLWGKGKRAYDWGNLVGGCKPLVDEIVGAGLLVDDRPSACQIFYDQGKSEDGKDWTSIVLEELPPL